MSETEHAAKPTRVCSKCEQEKPIEEFAKNNLYKGKRYRSACCKLCDNARRNAQYHATAPDENRWKHIESIYGVTREQWLHMFALQGSCCAICKTNKAGPRQANWQTEHDHKTKKFRGITCQHCNRMLGAARDNPGILREGALYLERNQ